MSSWGRIDVYSSITNSAVGVVSKHTSHTNEKEHCSLQSLRDTHTNDAPIPHLLFISWREDKSMANIDTKHLYS